MRRGLILVALTACGGAALSVLTAARNEAAQSPATVTVFTANTGGGSLSFVDGDTFAQASPTANVGATPNAVAVTKTGTRVAVTLRDSSTVQITDTDGTNPKTVDLSGGTLADLVWSPDVTRIYATQTSSSRVSVIDAIAGTEIDLFTLQMIGSTNSPRPTAIDISSDGQFLFILVASDGYVRKMRTSDGGIVDSATVDLGSVALRVSPDGSRLIVVGAGAPRVYDTVNLDPVGLGLSDIGDHIDVAVAGTRAYALNQASIQDENPAKRGPPRAGTPATLTGVDVYDLTNGTFVSSMNFISNATLHSVAVTPDGAKVYVARSGSEENGTVTRYDTVTGADEGSANVGTRPEDIALFAKSPILDVDSYFLPRKVKLALKGENRDEIIASGYYDDGGSTIDFDDDVVVTVGSFTRRFKLLPNAKGTVNKFQDETIKMVVVPNLKGSSRGRFRLRAAKTTLAGLIPETGPVEFHFSGTGLPNAGGRIELGDGAYKLGGKRGALDAPVFFAAKGSAKLAGDGADTLNFTGGFATGGVTPANLGPVSFSFGSFGPVQFPALTRKGDVYKGTLVVGSSKTKITIDFLRETVTVSVKKVELGALDTPTVDVLFDPGLGDGAAVNTIRLGGTGSVRKY